MTDDVLTAVMVIDNACRRRWQGADHNDGTARELKAAVATVRRAALAGLRDAPEQFAPVDAEALVSAYIASGADWRELVAAVNRHGLDAARRS